MSAWHIAAGLLCLGLVVYLIIALLNAEDL
jgi:K+-transporting ATPase KdpF subunit